MFPFNDAGTWSGLALGAMFGFVLERAGFGSPCKLTGQFRLTDWSVLKVMFTAIVVAATGLWLLRVTGLLVEDAIYVPTSFVVAAAVGGALVGAGFAIGGYCPGTSVVGLFSGRLDAFVFLAGLVAGTALFAMVYGEALEAFLVSGEVMSGDTVGEAWSIPDPVLIGAMLAALVAVFVFGGRFERRAGGPVTADQAVHGADQATDDSALFPQTRSTP